MPVSVKVAENGSLRSPNCTSGLQSIAGKGLLAIASRASNRLDRCAKLITVPRQRAIARGTFENLGRFQWQSPKS